MGKVWSPAKTRPYGKDPAYNRETGSRREGSRLAAEAVRAMTARTTQPRPSKGPLGERGRRLQERLGVVPLAAITRRGAVPVWLRASWSNPAVAAKAASQPANCRRHEGLVEEPVAAHAVGNAVADMRSLPAGLGKTQRPVDRGAGGNRRQSALPCGARRLSPTRPPADRRGTSGPDGRSYPRERAGRSRASRRMAAGRGGARHRYGPGA